MKIKFIIFIVIGLFFSYSLFGDSPLTSTNFSDVYNDVDIVQLASLTDGVLIDDLMSYLYNIRNPLELKIALINKLAWDINGKNNAEIFYNFLKEKNKLFNINNASSEILICYAYLMALDNYFEVDEAILYARKAKSKNAKSYVVNIICALIEAQMIMDDDWCDIYNFTNNVRIDKTLKKDMREEAVSIIFDYMDRYKKYCK